MVFEEGHLYHLFNQGNNREDVFLSRANYLFFLTKVKQHILPHADILAWCLMPNHFHLMIYVHTVAVSPIVVSPIGGTTLSRATNRRNNTDSNDPTNNNDSEALNGNTRRARDLNKSIGILLASYTRAINMQQQRSGSLFRQHTKAECITSAKGLTPGFFNTIFGSQINVRIPENEYPQACFEYIHMNPVKAKMVDRPEDWEFSSASDYSGKRSGKLVDKERAAEFVSYGKLDGEV